MTEKSRTKTHARRYEELKQILEERGYKIIGEVQEKIHDIRAEAADDQAIVVRDEAESSEADMREDIEFVLLQMKSETLKKINEALARLEDGTYGYCSECGEEISGQRLQALPFAVRCKDCEEASEIVRQRERVLAQRSRRTGLFFYT